MSKITQRISRWALVSIVVLVALLSNSHSAPAAADSTQPFFDQRDHPVHLIASYYNAIALQDYGRAYNYWNGRVPNGVSFQQFAQGFSDVQTVHALARLPVRVGVAAGTAHAEVPVVVLTTLKSGGSQIFAGCFHVTHTNVPIGDPPVIDPDWHLYSASLQQVSSVDFEQAVSACNYVESFPTSGQADNRLYPIDLISSYYDAIAAHDYVRAYNYWPNGAPGQTYAQFVQGFAHTDNIGVVVALSFTIEGAAGSMYADAPLLITATDSGVPQLFVGCMVTRKSNVPVGNATTPDPNWYLSRASIHQVTTLDLALQQVWDICTTS